MKPKESKTTSIQINKTLLQKYKNFCETHGYMISGRIKKFIHSELSGSLVWEK